MAKTFRPPLFLRLGNAIMTFLLRSGVRVNTTTLLTVRGRKSGQPRTTPVTLIKYDGQRWLIAPFGAVDWVRNLRAAGEATLTRGRRSEHVSAVEVNAQEAAPVLKQGLAIAPSLVRERFDVTPESSLADFEREAPRHPVFLLKSLSEQQITHTVAPEKQENVSW